MRYAAYKVRVLNGNNSNGTQRDHEKFEKKIADISIANVTEPSFYERVHVATLETI